jgi:hypothetical protein
LLVQKSGAHVRTRNWTRHERPKQPVPIASEEIVPIIAYRTGYDFPDFEESPPPAKLFSQANDRVGAHQHALCARAIIVLDEDKRINAVQFAVPGADLGSEGPLKWRERDVAVPIMPKHELHGVITESAQAVVEEYGVAGGFVIHIRVKGNGIL